MKTIFDRVEREALIGRLRRLAPDARPLWGRMNAPQMVVHLARSCKLATGEVSGEKAPGPLRVWPLNVLVICYLPWPRGAPTAPVLMAGVPAGWQQDVGDLVRVIDDVGARGAQREWPEHLAFGRLTGRQWARLVYRHVDHHLRQFGV